MKKTLLFLLLFPSILVFSQNEEEEQKFGISFSGFVKNDMFFDTRQTVSAREGHFLLWPTTVSEDNNGDDINGISSFNILALQSRLSGTITGPNAFGAKTSGKIEGDFFAQADDNINLFRLRHAYVKLSWEKSDLIMGQYWNPLFVTSCFPGTLSFNTGTPFQPFARNPQIRYTYKIGSLQFIAAALAQRDYASRDTDNKSNAEMLRNTSVPDLHAQIHYSTEIISAGAGISYKTLLPKKTRTYIDTNATLYIAYDVISEDKISGLSIITFGAFKFSDIKLKVENTLGENLTDVLHISGFAITEADLISGEITYEPIKSNSTWIDLSFSRNSFEYGIFGGYYMKLGTKSDVLNNQVYGFGNNIASLMRFSPRIAYKSGKTKLGIEAEYTAGQFGETPDEKGVPTDTKSADNLRILFTAIYSF